MKQPSSFDIIICGGGHAGVEAALIASRLGCSVCVVTLDLNAIGRMSCNPAIGGLAKGQLVKEIDVLGGVMGFATDRSGLQYKILNKSKGKSVWSPRAQVDKRKYETFVSSLEEKGESIFTVEGEVVDLRTSGGGGFWCCVKRRKFYFSVYGYCDLWNFFKRVNSHWSKENSSRKNGGNWR